MDIVDNYCESDIAKDGEMDKVEFVVCSEDTDTASSEDDYSDTDSDFENH